MQQYIPHNQLSHVALSFLCEHRACGAHRSTLFYFSTPHHSADTGIMLPRLSPGL